MSIILRSTKGSALTYGEMDNNFIILSSSYATTSSNSFLGDQIFYGNITVLGTASFTSTTSSVTNISSSEFGVTIASPLIRYGSYNVYDSMLSQATASLIFDSFNKHWLYQNVTGSTTSSAILLTGPKSTGGLGTENNLAQYRIPVSNGDQSLIDSYIYSNGVNTTVSGALAVSNAISIGNVIDSSPQYGKFLVISGSYPGVILGHSNVGKAYSFGVGDFSQFFLNDDNLSVTRFVLESNGWFGLGKSATTFLDVNGNTFISGTLGVTGNITGNLTGTASYASFALTASHATNIPLTSSYALQALSSSFATTASFVRNAVSSSFATTSSLALNAVSSSFASTASFVLNAVSSSFATTASFVRNAVSASFASIASSVNPLSQSVVLTGSLATRNSLATTTFSTIGRSGSLYIDLSGVGLNYIDGNSLFVRNAAGTSNITVSTPSKFTVHVPTELSSSLSIQRADNNRLLSISSSVSSSNSSSIVGTTASFDGLLTFNPSGAPSNLWNTDLDIYYSGNSGSAHTDLSPVLNRPADNNSYDNFNITLNGRISLTPGGSIPDNKYSIWIYASGSINKWFQISDQNYSTLSVGGLNISLTPGSDTNSTLESDLITTGFAVMADPNPYDNNINTTIQVVNSFTSSLVDIKSNTILTGSLNVSGSTAFIGTHTLSGSNTITGNTFLSGSIEVSGSTRFSNSVFTVTGSQFYTGSSEFKGNQTITGSLRLQSNGIGTGLYINGQKQFNYISLYNTSSILPTQNVSGAFTFTSQVNATGISVVSGSRITFANTGEYNLQFSAQLYTQTAATVYIWLKRNGVNEPDSAGRLGPTQNGDYLIPAWNYVGQFTSGSYIELAYQTNQTNTQFQYVAPAGNIPGAPSIILSVVQVS